MNVGIHMLRLRCQEATIGVNTHLLSQQTDRPSSNQSARGLSYRSNEVGCAQSGFLQTNNKKLCMTADLCIIACVAMQHKQDANTSACTSKGPGTYLSQESRSHKSVSCSYMHCFLQHDIWAAKSQETFTHEHDRK